MKTSLEHLPEQRREELRRIALTIRESRDDVENHTPYTHYHAKHDEAIRDAIHDLPVFFPRAR